jgi:hypothetical protein
LARLCTGPFGVLFYAWNIAAVALIVSVIYIARDDSLAKIGHGGIATAAEVIWIGLIVIAWLLGNAIIGGIVRVSRPAAEPSVQAIPVVYHVAQPATTGAPIAALEITAPYRDISSPGPVLPHYRGYMLRQQQAGPRCGVVETA